MRALRTVARIGILSGKSKLLWVSDEPAPDSIRRAADGWDIADCRLNEPLCGQLADASVALICPNSWADDACLISSIVHELGRWGALAIFLLPAEAKSAWRLLSSRRGQFLCMRQDGPASELSAKLQAVSALEPAIRGLQSELAAARNFTDEAGGRFDELDEQMRLAARLQRDFLPRRLPEVAPVRFAVFYRPISWVSGDIYDVTRLDETNVGFYVADAVGHGMPAALLTMFIKKALQTKRIVGHSYEIVPPDAAMEGLNTDICEQNLSNCQFCTAAYCLIDTSTLMLTYSRAGHPDPILIRANGQVERLRCPGSLLGVFPEETFQSQTLQLGPGDRLLLYTDGAESALQGPSGDPSVPQVPARWGTLPRDRLLLEFASQFNRRTRSRRADDVTLLVMDVEA